MNREVLENIATHTVSPDYYYNLCDNINEISDEQLKGIIACKGSYFLELIYESYVKGEDLNITLDDIKDILHDENIIKKSK